jgi:hypothetical protein
MVSLNRCAPTFPHILFLPHQPEYKKLTEKEIMKYEPIGVLGRPLNAGEVNCKFHNRNGSNGLNHNVDGDGHRIRQKS